MTRSTPACLPGLRPEPLASYLAGLGLIRLIGEQADPGATARWSSRMGWSSTRPWPTSPAWLAEEYVPTPVLSPWNGGSGFGAKDKEPKRSAGGPAGSPHPGWQRSGKRSTPRAGLGKARAAGWIKADAKGVEKIVNDEDKGRSSRSSETAARTSCCRGSTRR